MDHLVAWEHGKRLMWKIVFLIWKHRKFAHYLMLVLDNSLGFGHFLLFSFHLRSKLVNCLQ